MRKRRKNPVRHYVKYTGAKYFALEELKKAWLTTITYKGTIYSVEKALTGEYFLEPVKEAPLVTKGDITCKKGTLWLKIAEPLVPNRRRQNTNTFEIEMII